MTKRLKSLKAKSLEGYDFLKDQPLRKALLSSVLSIQRQSFDLPALFPNRS